MALRHSAGLVGSASPLIGLMRAAWWRIAALAALDFAWFMVLPLTVNFVVNARADVILPVAFGTCAELARLIVRQRVRRRLRHTFMMSTARQALWKSTAIPEVRSDAAFWGAHIAEYAVSLDAPAILGAGASSVLTLGMAAHRTGAGPALQVGTVLLGAVVLGVLSNRLRRRGVDAIVDRRQLTATWMAAATRDEGELAAPLATARFLERLAETTAAWCLAEDAVERARTRHRLGIAVVAGLALYAVARAHGVDLVRGVRTADLPAHSLIGAMLLGSCLPAAYAFAAHLESISVANSELTRLALGVTERQLGACIRLERRPLLLRSTGVTAHHDQVLALDLGELEVRLEKPVGIAGPNGSGKTTFATLLAGLRSLSSGSLELDGVRTTDLSRDDVAFVPQNPLLIESLSIAENLRLVAADYDPIEARKLLESLGLDTPLGKAAGSLSRGEQRRIAIARAILKRPKILILDEPDAWLDVDGRRSLIRVLKAASTQASVIVVSHRPDVLVQFETVVVLDEHHRVEAVAHPSELKIASAAFRALLGAEQHEDSPRVLPH